LWGHGFYGNETGLKRWFRLLLLRQADAIFVYGKHAKGLLSNFGFDADRIHIVYNSLDYDKHRALRTRLIDPIFYRNAGYFKNPECPILIFVGRLTPQKELWRAIEAVAKLDSMQFNLILVGDGPELEKLQQQAASLEGRVYFYGACYDEELLGSLIANADLCLSPGEVGLTAIHSLSFGTPVCTHDGFSQQMPEVEAVQPGKTGIFFSKDKMNIGDALQQWFGQTLHRERIRQDCYDIVDSRYNPYHQTEIIEAALEQMLHPCKNDARSSN